jgi:hypothetical protein
MKTAKELVAGFYRGDELAKRATSCKRIASEATSTAHDGLGLTQQDRETLGRAAALLRDMAAVYAKAASLRKAAEAEWAKWVKAARAAMKENFETLASTADKVALIGFTKPHQLDLAALRGDRGAWHAQYLVKDIFGDCLNDLAYGLSPRLDGVGAKDKVPVATVAAEWLRFLERREQLQDRYAQVIVLVDRLLSHEAVA